MKEITQFYTESVRIYVIPFYCSSGTGTVLYYNSSSANYIMVPVLLRQKFTVPTVPFPQHCFFGMFIL
jgi:hypothetical protein